MAISFDRVADVYDQTRAMPPEVAEQVTEAILRLGRTTPESHFLEPGIGTGRIALPIVERGYAYTGVDVSEAMMDVLRQKLAGQPHRLTLVNADATALPFEPATFDVAVAPHILHLIADWRQALAEIRRVLKPAGVFIYFHHPTNRSGIRDDIAQRWHEILQGYGYESGFTGGITEDVLDYLQAQQAKLHTEAVAKIRHSRTPAEALQSYQKRIYSNLWRVPDEIYPRALTDLQTWVQQQFPDPAVELNAEYEVTLTAAYSWST